MKQPKEKTAYGLPAQLAISLESFLLTFGLTATGLMCLVTAFHLPLEVGKLMVYLALGSFGASLLNSLRWGRLLMGATWAIGLLAVLLWGLEPLEQSLRLVYTSLSTVYARAYGIVGLPLWPPEDGATALQALTLWGLITATVAASTILHRESLIATALLSLVPLILCLVVVDTPPAIGWLLAFLALQCLLFLTQGCRRRSGWQGAKLTLFLGLPLVALLLGLYALLPQEGYARSPLGQKILQAMVDFSSQYIPLNAELLGDLDARVPISRSESLEVGPRRDSKDEVMRVQSTLGETLYLRGLTYGIYTGTAWEQIPEREYPEGASREGLTIPGEAGREESVRIRTSGDRAVIYTPYYLLQLPEVGEPLRDCGVENTERLRTYEVSFAEGDDLYPVMEFETEYRDFVYETYTQLPEETRLLALGIARQWQADEIPQESLPWFLAQRVSESARYDLETPRMPRGKDFAIWFLEESDTGYCVHYATSVVVMLRAMGIPARYVTGYLCRAREGVWSPVTGQNAHAWAEYYVDGVGWVPLEATPAAGVASTENPTETTAPTSEPEDTTEITTEEVTHTRPPKDIVTGPDGEEVTEPSSGFHGFRITIPSWIWWVLGCIALAVGRRPLTIALVERRKGRRGASRKGGENRRFLRDWKSACRLAKVLQAPEAHRELALKARFSQHEIAPEEWESFHRWCDALRETLNKAPWYRRILIRYVLIWDVF